MSIIGDVVTDALSNVFTFARRDRGLERLMAEGELLPARIYAIRYVEQHDTADTWLYGLDVPTAAGPLRVTVRQQLLPEPERAHLGATVLVRHRDGEVAIDWEETLRRAGVDLGEDPAVGFRTKQLRQPIEPGVDHRGSDRSRLQKGRRAQARITGIAPVVVMGMSTDAWNVRLVVDDDGAARPVASRRMRVPAFAVHLLVEGTTVPVAIDRRRPDRVTVDWASAAEQAVATTP